MIMDTYMDTKKEIDELSKTSESNVTILMH